MKGNKFLGYCSILTMAATLTACSNDDVNNTGDGTGGQTAGVQWTTNGDLDACNHILFSKDGKANVDDNGTQIGSGDKAFVFTGKQTLKKGTYTLKGWVYIADGAELTIEPGTIIKGDKNTQAALIAERGGKLIAKGTASAPIVFTSNSVPGQRRPGDWGGVILCGKARNNAGEMQIEGGPRTKHGGDDNADNSGTLQYVRIEFAGFPFQKDKEINGLTLGSVGSGTTIDHVQVSYSNDDSFEWFGGDVNCKYLIAYKGWDDDFDTDNGFSGKVQFGLVVRDPKLADTSLSNGFESDNNASGSTAEPTTSAVFSNITFIGPKAGATDFVNTTDYINGGGLNPDNGSSIGLFQAAMQIRRNSNLNCFNSVAVGYPVGLILDNEKGNTQAAATAGKLKLQNLVFADMDALGADANKSFIDHLVTSYSPLTYDESKPSFSSEFFKKAGNNNTYLATADGLFTTKGGYMPAPGSMLLSGAKFTDSLLSSWFTQVSYIGAFGQNDTWADGWTNFDPQNTQY